VASSLNNLANLLQDTGDREAARRLHQRALAIREAALGPDHSDVAQSLNNLGILARAAGDLGESEALYRRALSIYEEALGPDSRKVAVSYYNLAGVVALQGDGEKALRFLEEALARGLVTDGLAEDPDFVSLHGDTEFEAMVAALAGNAGRR